jgi:hypothetical protein
MNSMTSARIEKVAAELSEALEDVVVFSMTSARIEIEKIAAALSDRRRGGAFGHRTVAAFARALWARLRVHRVFISK